MSGAAIAAWFATAAALISCSALAASRARYGGSLRAAVVGRPPESEPSLADAPSEAAILSITASPLCRLDDARRIRPVLASEMSWEVPSKLAVALRPEMKFENGTAASANDVAASWSRLSRPGSLSPYRALLFPLHSEGQRFPPASSQQLLELPLSFAWPDLVASLCHPALAIRPATASRSGGIGPFRATSTPHEFEANLGYPLGRPFLDRLSLSFTDERGAARLVALRQAQVALGPGAAGPLAGASPALYSTYLAFKPERAGADFRQAFEATIDRNDLTRFFVSAPSVPMHSLLPPALMPHEPASRPPAPAQAGARALTLMFDPSLPEQRLVAERLQVKLHELKYAISLKPVSRAQLRAAWSTGNFDLMLHAVLLPPFAGPALAVAIETSGRHELLSAELPGIGTLAGAADRERMALERARALLPALPLIPLYAQAARMVGGGEVLSLKLDGYGLPALDDAFLLPE